ncbi:MAG: GTP-binding protein [Desulfobacterales bacterium]|jgi:G3E family GTPase|nr:GTP-binding protein [Desulfobacterales bacterium]
MNRNFSSKRNKTTEIILLSGFLGSGKTTLLKRILSWENNLSETVVLVNEFGDVGIDGALLKDSGSEVVELTSGCICCTLQIDLKQTLTQIRERFRPRRILIEASGIADPATIASLIQEPDMQPHMELKKIVTVLDAECWQAREAFGTVFYNQLKFADLIFLNKIDLFDQDEIRRFLKEIHAALPQPRVVPTLYCRVDPDTIWAARSGQDSELKRVDFADIDLLEPRSREGQPHRHDNKDGKKQGHHAKAGDADNYTAFSFHDPRVLDETCFKRFLEDLPWELFRLKGSVRFKDRTAFVNFVGGKCELTSWAGAPETRLTFIGWNVNGAEAIKCLKNCLVGN